MTGSRRFELSCHFHLVGHSAQEEGFHCMPLHLDNRVRLQVIRKAHHVAACSDGVQMQLVASGGER